MAVNNVPNQPPISTPGKLLTLVSIGTYLTNLVNSLSNAFSTFSIAINGLIADDNTNTAAIATNTSAIATNTVDIAANTAAIAAIPAGPSLPLSIANGGTGDTGTAWTTYTPSVLISISGTATAAGKYKSIGKTVFFQLDVVFTSIVAGNLTIGLPPITAHGQVVASGSEKNSFVAATARFATGSTTTVFVYKYDGTNFTANTSTITVTGIYEST